jgi:hypothetical protein
MDWNSPGLTTPYTTVLSDLRARDVSAAIWFEGSSDTNIPTNSKRFNGTSKKLEKWNGSAWVDLWPELDSHLASTSNPHSTTAAQVGAPTEAEFDSHVADTGNPHSTTAAQVGAPSTASFNSHVGNVSNPHATTAAQVGALATANSLSELAASASTARSNIGAASASTLSSHTSNTSNPHSVTRGQIGAAASGANSDITSLTACASVRAAGTVVIGSTAHLTSLTLAQPNGNNLALGDNTYFYPVVAGGDKSRLRIKLVQRDYLHVSRGAGVGASRFIRGRE